MSDAVTEQPLVLGIETSCDETGVGIVRGTELLVDAIASSVDEHARFDRAELVKTVRMDAFDRSAVEAAGDSARAVAGFLEDQRFAPDVLVLPPRVLTRKWQDGARVSVNGAAPGGGTRRDDRAALATTVQAPAASREPDVDDEGDGADERGAMEGIQGDRHRIRRCREQGAPRTWLPGSVADVQPGLPPACRFPAS